MSVEASKWAWEQATPPGEKLVLLCLADHADEIGSNCYPSQGRIAKKTKMARETVNRIIKRLVAGNYVRLTKITIFGKDLMAYQLNLKNEKVELIHDHTPVTENHTDEINGAENGVTYDHAPFIEPSGKDISSVSLRVKDTLRDTSDHAQKNGRRVSDPRIRELIDNFFDRTEARLGEKPVFNGGAAARGFAALLARFDRPEIESRMDSWFSSQDNFFEKRSWRVEDFISNFNALKNGPIQRGDQNGRQGNLENGNENNRGRYRTGRSFAGLGRKLSTDSIPDGRSGPDGRLGSPEEVPK